MTSQALLVSSFDLLCPAAYDDSTYLWYEYGWHLEE